ncbi:MAG TPA: hypothetical protein VNT28_06220 [Candidatus Limnocylindrales bacterium]|jgi:hypothetical protein|nr:hypothetical protein [Candidatus Limnocylindrales bacterium]
MPSGAVLLASSRRPRAGRLPLGVLVGVVIAAWIVISFGRTLATLNETDERLADIRAETAALEMRIRQGEAEMELAQTPAFQRMLARAYGMGSPGERAFALESGAPPPPAVVPLGAPATSSSAAPLDAWLEILFGD